MMEKAQQPEEISASFQLSKAEYVRGVRFYLRKSHLVSWVQLAVMLVALAGVAVTARLMERMSFLNTLVLVLVVMVTCYGGYLYGRKPGQIFKRDPSLGRSVSFLFTQEDITRQNEQEAAILDWSAQKLWRGKEFYYLFDREGGYTMLPLRGFRSEEDRLRFEMLAQAACPGMRFRRFS